LRFIRAARTVVQDTMQTKQPFRGSQFVDRVAAGLLTIVALLTYLTTLSPGLYPGASARLIVSKTGLMPPVSPVFPLWTAAAKLAAAIPVGSLATRYNALSAVFGALCVGLMYLVMVGTLALLVEKGSRSVLTTWVAVRLAGLTAALCLAFCAPFWIVSTRAHVASFDTALMLGVAWLLLVFAVHRKFWVLYLFAFAYGLSTVESATFISMAPLYIVVVLLMLHWLEALNGRVILRLCICALCGLLLYLVVALLFYLSPSYELYEYESFFKVVWYMWLNQYRLLMRALPRVWWLVILLLTIAPWFVGVLMLRKSLNEESDWSVCVLHVIMTVLAVVVILNLKFSPWQLAGPHRLLVSPYVLVASLTGYLAAYWLLLPSQWRIEREQRGKLRVRSVLGPLLACPIVVLVAIAPFLNAAKVDPRDARPINAYAREVIRHVAGHEWLVTDGVLDDHLRLLARDMNCDIELLNLRQGNDGPYMRYVAQRVDDERLGSLAGVGLSVFLQEWLDTTPDIATKFAVFGPVGLWRDVDLMSVPCGPLLVGTKTLDGVDGAALLRDMKSFADRVVPGLREVQDSVRVGPRAKQLLRYTGLIANNTGVVLQDLNRPDDAFAAYILARQIDTNNVSALFNQAGMIEGGFETEGAPAVRAAVDEIKNAGKLFDVWRLSRVHGTVRTPEATAGLGVALALTGRREAAVRDLTRALDQEPDGDDPLLRQTLAAVYLSGDDQAKGEEIYLDILAGDPGNVPVLESMVRLTMQRGAFDESEQYLERAQKAGMSGEAFAAAKASLCLLRGDKVAARSVLDESIDRYPESLQLLTMRAGLADSMGDDILFSQCLNRIRGLPDGAGHAAQVAAVAALRKQDYSAARSHLERVLNARIADERVLNALLELDLREKRSDLAERHARRLLVMNPRHALAAYVLGTVQIDRGNLELAEASLRSSIRHKKTPVALNDLAWLLERRGKYEEAETLAREAVALLDRAPSFWDTLGVTLMRTGKYEEADAALRKSLELGATSAATDLHMAELQVLRGKVDEARRFLRRAENAQQRLSLEDREELAALRRRLAGIASPR
jgi:tetratricopeptide (TPR) repeat protein